MLTFEEVAINQLIEEHRRALSSIKVPNGWGCGPIVDNFSGLQGAFFRVLGRKDRTPGKYSRDPGDGMEGATDECFHPTTRIRKYQLRQYDPMALRGYIPQVLDGIAGWHWVRNRGRAMPEHVMRPEKVMSLVSSNEDRSVKYWFDKSLSRKLCPESILNDLDRDNGIVRTPN
jgi:hypothetical protein